LKKSAALMRQAKARSAKKARAEAGMRRAESSRQRQEALRAKVSEAEAARDRALRRDRRQTLRGSRGLEVRSRRAEAERRAHEKERRTERKNERRGWFFRMVQQIRKEKAAEKHEAGRRKKAWSENWKEARRVNKFKSDDAAVKAALEKEKWSEVALGKNEAARQRNEARRAAEAKEVDAGGRTDLIMTAKKDHNRSLAEDVRSKAEALRQRAMQNDLIVVSGATKNALRRELQFQKNTEFWHKKGLETIELLQRISDTANATEARLLLAELSRKHYELKRLRESEDDQARLARAIRGLTGAEEARADAEHARMTEWKDTLMKLSQEVLVAAGIETQAEKAEKSRKAEEAKRSSDAEEMLKKLLAGEALVRNDQAAARSSEQKRKDSENARAKSLQDTVNKLLGGEHWLKGLEVERWAHEMKAEEQEKWRMEQQRAHKDFLARLTGNVTHDEMLRRQHESERAQAEQERMKALTASADEASSEEGTELQDESLRQQNEVERVGAEDRREREDQDDEDKIHSEMSKLEHMELQRRQNEKRREKAELARQVAEEMRFQEILKAAKKEGPRGPRGPPGPPGYTTPPPNEAHGAELEEVHLEGDV